jgi:hypothetical protein
MDTPDLLSRTPSISKYLMPGYFSEINGVDLDLPVFVGGYLPALCILNLD